MSTDFVEKQHLGEDLGVLAGYLQALMDMQGGNFSQEHGRQGQESPGKSAEG